MHKAIPVSLVSLALAGCAASNIPHYTAYEAPPGTVHSLYPFQLDGRPVTPNERVQANSRGSYDYPAVSCQVGGIAVSVVGNLVQVSYTDKKKWPQYGYVSGNGWRVNKAPDGSNNIELVYQVEEVKNNARDVSSGSFMNSIHRLSWNDEKLDDGWMHGQYELRGFGGYSDHKLFYADSEMKRYKTRCIYLKPDVAAKLTLASALSTMTPEQREAFRNTAKEQRE